MSNKQYHLDRVARRRQAAVASPTKENLRRLGIALNGLGQYASQGERKYTEAIGFLEEACAIFVKLHDEPNAAKAYFNLGLTYEIGLQEYDLAHRYVRKARELAATPRLAAYYERELDCIAVSRVKKHRG